jgi:hypothetical protein
MTENTIKSVSFLFWPDSPEFRWALHAVGARAASMNKLFGMKRKEKNTSDSFSSII